MILDEKEENCLVNNFEFNNKISEKFKMML